MRLAQPKAILVLLVSRIGDTLLCTPALHALKSTWPNVQLTVLAHPARLPLLQANPDIDVLAGFSFAQRCWAGLHRLLGGGKAYDAAFVFAPDARQLRFASAHAQQVYLPKPLADWPQAVSPASFDGKMVAVEERLRLVECAGAQTDDDRLRYHVLPEEAERARGWLAAHGFFQGPAIALQLKSFPTKAHRDWPLAHFTDLLTRLGLHYPSARVLITGDSASTADAAKLVHAFPDLVVDGTGCFSLRETAAVLAAMNLYIGVDTGPTHLAGALGLPMIALYHAAYPGKYLAPRQHPACCVIEHPDAEVAGRDSAAAEMAAIPVDRVWQAVPSLLAQGGW